MRNRHAGMQTERQADREAGRQVGREAVMWECRHAGRHIDR